MPTRILFVADQLATDERGPGEHRPGGAELTDAAAIAACPWPITVRRLRELTPSDLDADVIIVANAAAATPDQLAAIARSGRHVLFEHDLRVCRWRGDFPSGDLVHRLTHRCGCRPTRFRALFASALGIVYLTDRQRRAYLANPSYAPPREAVLGSSLFTDETLARLCPSVERDRHSAIAWSKHRIKGHAIAWDYCRARGWPVREIRQRSYADTLALLGRSQRFVYLPLGLEPAGRMPVEARLLGCEVVVDAHVGVAHEPLWSMSRDAAVAHLAAAPRRFWTLVESLSNASEGALAPAIAVERPDLTRELQTVRRRPDAADAWLSERVLTAIRDVDVVAPW